MYKSLIFRKMVSLPPFTNDGVLPVGDYSLTLDELLVSQLVIGWQDGGEWDVAWRQTLAMNLLVMVGHLQQVGIRDIFIDGSFVEEQASPKRYRRVLYLRSRFVL